MNTESWEGKVILAVEDDDVSLEFLKELFEPYKVKLLSTNNGKSAIDICKSEKQIDLVLMDVQLPVLNGKEAMKQIKYFRPDLPIIAQTAFAMAGDREMYIDEGFDDYIPKPINVEQLLSSMDRFIG
ncbi:MAG: response regulator [Bacteroidales bacterium]|nr:response regulator [Bacteroidales bacterium]